MKLVRKAANRKWHAVLRHERTVCGIEFKDRTSEYKDVIRRDEIDMRTVCARCVD